MWSSQLLANRLDNISTNGKLIWQNDYGKSMWHQLDRKTITITTIDIWRTMFLKLTRFKIVDRDDGKLGEGLGARKYGEILEHHTIL